ncbi:MAG TPA: hypothetical protein V6D15_02130 [Oculatellaceae cyanobacterium]
MNQSANIKAAPILIIKHLRSPVRVELTDQRFAVSIIYLGRSGTICHLSWQANHN